MTVQVPVTPNGNGEVPEPLLPGLIVNVLDKPRFYYISYSKLILQVTVNGDVPVL